MPGLIVRKVTVRGPQFIGVERGLNLKGKVGVDIHTNRGVINVRLDDFRGTTLAPISPLSNPSLMQQSFVVGPVIDRAAELLASERHFQSSERLLPQAEAEIDFSHLTFGLNASHAMFAARLNRGGDWHAIPIEQSVFPFEDLTMNPVAQVLHYGSSGFEGCKAYRSEKGNIVSFRLAENAKRQARTSARLALTPIPVDYYLAAIRATVLANDHLLAPPGLGASMYVRPLHFAYGPQLGVSTAATEAFIVVVSPVGPYFKGGFSAKPMLVEETYHRSGPGLTGDVKAIGNYAGSILPGMNAKSRGIVSFASMGDNATAKWDALIREGYIDEIGRMNQFNDVRESLDLKGKVSRTEEDQLFQVLKFSHYAEAIYLDASGVNVEEVGAANAFFVVDNVLYTPALSGTILPGITRDSIITLARDMGLRVVDNQLVPIDFAMRASEAFCTGTAAVVSPVGTVVKGNKVAVFNNGQVGPITQRLYDTLVGIQEERLRDPYGWVYRIA